MTWVQFVALVSSGKARELWLFERFFNAEKSGWSFFL
jgi:hypothetical protein